MARNANNAPVADEVMVEPTVNATTPEVNAVGHQNIIKKLIAEGAKRINGVRIKNVNFSEQDNYTRVSITPATPIRGFISKDNGVTYEEGMVNTIFSSLYAITGALKEDEDLAWMANALLENPQALVLIFAGGTVDIIQQYIVAGTEFTNPFTTKEDAEVQSYDHDIIINHLVKFNVGKTGEKMANRLADKMLGF